VSVKAVRHPIPDGTDAALNEPEQGRLDHSGFVFRNHLTNISNCLPRLAGSASKVR
jgi:hypothetical protein